MAGETARELRVESPRRDEGASLICTLTGGDGRELGTLTIDLGSTAGHNSEQRAGLLYRGASILAEAIPVNGPGAPGMHWEDVSGAQPELAIHAVLVRRGEVVDERAFAVPASESDFSSVPRPPLGDLVAGYERSLIHDALRATMGNRARAAKLLHTTERILSYRIRQYGIDCRDYRNGGGRKAKG